MVVVITRKAALEEVGMKMTAWVYHDMRDVSDDGFFKYKC
jgi:hypothetical protein